MNEIFRAINPFEFFRDPELDAIDELRLAHVENLASKTELLTPLVTVESAPPEVVKETTETVQPAAEAEALNGDIAPIDLEAVWATINAETSEGVDYAEAA